MKILPAAALAALFCFAQAKAADYYVTPDGAGKRDASSWNDAASKDRLATLARETLRPGDRVLLGSGVYRGLPHTNNTLVVLSASGTPDRPITIEGVDTGGGLPQIEGRWSETNPRYHAHSATAIALADGASHVRIRNLQITGCMQGLTARGNNRDVRVEGLTIRRCREGFILRDTSASEIRSCRIASYTKRGIRFERGCHDLLIVDVVADATEGSTSWPTEAFPFGFSIEDDAGNYAIRFERCTARNNRFPGEPDSYWNGDGFVAEAAAREISYVDCLSIGNTDGGWDDKSRSALLVGCVAIGNKRAFRLWNVRGDAEHPSRLENCLGIFSRSEGGIGSAAGLWVCGAVEVEHSTFHNNADFAVAIENNGPGGELVARNCILSSGQTTEAKPLVLQESGTRYTPTGVVRWQEGREGDDPEYVAPSPTWGGRPADAFDSRRFGPEKGYWSARKSDE